MIKSDPSAAPRNMHATMEILLFSGAASRSPFVLYLRPRTHLPTDGICVPMCPYELTAAMPYLLQIIGSHAEQGQSVLLRYNHVAHIQAAMIVDACHQKK